MKDTFKINDSYVFGDYTYHYQAVTKAAYQLGQLDDYRDYIKRIVRNKFHNSLELEGLISDTSIGRVSPNYTANYIVDFASKRNMHYYQNPREILREMEDGPVPPRHIWDKSFPKRIRLTLTVYHVVIRVRRRLDTKYVGWTDSFAREVVTAYEVDGSRTGRQAGRTTNYVNTTRPASREVGSYSVQIQGLGREQEEMIARYRTYINSLLDAQSGTITTER